MSSQKHHHHHNNHTDTPSQKTQPPHTYTHTREQQPITLYSMISIPTTPTTHNSILYGTNLYNTCTHPPTRTHAPTYIHPYPHAHTLTHIHTHLPTPLTHSPIHPHTHTHIPLPTIPVPYICPQWQLITHIDTNHRSRD